MKTFLVNTTADLYDQGEVPVASKVWGSETLLVGNENYTVKVMKLQPKHKCSFHTHKNKLESFVLLQGSLIVDLINSSNGKMITLTFKDKFETVTLEPMTIHSFRCPDNQKEETVFIECSTKDEASDSYRFTSSQ